MRDLDIPPSITLQFKIFFGGGGANMFLEKSLSSLHGFNLLERGLGGRIRQKDPFPESFWPLSLSLPVAQFVVASSHPCLKIIQHGNKEEE